GMYKGKNKLKDNISEKTFNLAQKTIKNMGMNINQFNSFKPWFLAMSIISFKLVKIGYDPNWGIDKYFLDKASGKKEIEEIEGLEYQLNLFNNFSKKEQEIFLYSTLKEVSQYDDQIDKIVKYWESGNTKKIEDLFSKNIKLFPDSEKIYKKLLNERNKKMAERIETYMQTGKIYFIVVGTAHLVGKKGIIHLLEEKGFELKQF
ncbi:MAG: TraB/GumN family protein, partial [Candidatus Aminicenantaceae bacterium]